MKAPKSYPSLLALLFLILGGVFSLLGLLPLPMRSGSARRFLIGGLPLLLAGILLLWYARKTERSWERLRAEGQSVPGQMAPEATRFHWYTHWGSDGLRKRSPWTVLCVYCWEGRIYSVRSQFLWRQPRQIGQHPTVYLDSRNPKRAWIDPDTLAYEV